MEKLRNYLLDQKIEKIIDFATGRGEFIGMIRYLTGDDTEIWGIDSNPRMIELAGKNFPEAHFERNDAVSLTYEDNSFDLACLSNSLHHFADPKSVVHEMKRLVKQSGFIIIQEMVCDQDQSAAQQSHIMLHHFCAEIDLLCGEYHEPTWNSKKLADFIRDNFNQTVFKLNYSYPVPDEHDTGLLDRYARTIDFYLKKLEGRTEQAELTIRGKSISDFLQKNGYAPAREIIYLLR